MIALDGPGFIALRAGGGAGAAGPRDRTSGPGEPVQSLLHNRLHRVNTDPLPFLKPVPSHRAAVQVFIEVPQLHIYVSR